MHHDPNQYRLDFESATAERRTMLLSALNIAGHKRLTPLALLVLNYQERSGGQPLEWPVTRYAQEFDTCERTVQRRTRALEISGILTVEERLSGQGGQQTNRLGINWPRVREIARLPRDRSRPPLSPRPVKKSPGGAILSPTLSEFLSPQKLEDSTTSLPSQARGTIVDGRCIATLRKPEPTRDPRSEEEIFLEKLKRYCKEKIPNGARRLDEALRAALARGFTRDALAARCSWFARNENWQRWSSVHRGGAFYRGLVEYCDPDGPPHEGWPYR